MRTPSTTLRTGLPASSVAWSFSVTMDLVGSEPAESRSCGSFAATAWGTCSCRPLSLRPDTGLRNRRSSTAPGKAWACSRSARVEAGVGSGFEAAARDASVLPETWLSDAAAASLDFALASAGFFFCAGPSSINVVVSLAVDRYVEDSSLAAGFASFAAAAGGGEGGDFCCGCCCCCCC
ncbi:hypothetical protein VTK73DRAFT_6453 [Phialemonium thermophilum]|uniref:Secreted protein n=1 Tax=Phialemonium thermophilum TaxID=223376 RepID=A0ABR3UZN5_9PEZI